MFKSVTLIRDLGEGTYLDSRKKNFNHVEKNKKKKTFFFEKETVNRWFKINNERGDNTSGLFTF